MLRGCKSTVGCAVSLGEKSSPRVGTSSFMKKIQSNQPHPSPKYTMKRMQWGCWVLEGSSGPAPSSEKSSHKEGIHRVTEMTLIFKTFNQLLHYKRTQVRTSPKDCNEPSGAAGDGFCPEVCHLATRCIEGGGGSHETLAERASLVLRSTIARLTTTRCQVYVRVAEAIDSVLGTSSAIFAAPVC